MDSVAQVRKQSLADTKILTRAVTDSFRKLAPRTMLKNPVMFVVEVGAVLTTVQLVWNAFHHVARLASACKSPFGCGSRFFSRTSRKPWPKDGARHKQTLCVKHGLRLRLTC